MSNKIYTHSLVVPIVLDAMCFEKGKSHEIKSGYVDYNNSHPLPKNFEIEELGELQTGVHLHWELPNALRHGSYINGNLEFPLVPNRWLIRRVTGHPHSGNQKIWLVKSDELVHAPEIDTSEALKEAYAKQRILGTSVPHQNNKGENKVGEEKYIGVTYNNWKFEDLYYKNTKDDKSIALTSVSWVSPHFSSFAPFCRNVFGTIDTDVKAGEEYNYTVIGWFDTPEDDIVFKLPSDSDSLASFLEKSDWELPNDINMDDLSGVNSYYVGEIKGVYYGENQEVPELDEAPKLTIDTTITGAFTSMHKKHLKEEKLLQLVLNEQHKKFDDTALAAEKKIKDSLDQQEFLKENDGYYWVFKKGENPKGKKLTDTDVTNFVKEINYEQELLNRLFKTIKTVRLKLFKKHYTSLTLKDSEQDLIASINALKAEIKDQRQQILRLVNGYESEFQKIARKPYLEPKDPSLLIKNLLPKDETRMDAVLKIAVLEEEHEADALDTGHKQVFEEESISYPNGIKKSIVLSSTLLSILRKLSSKTLFDTSETDDPRYVSYSKHWDKNHWSPVFVDYEIEAYDFHFSNWEFNNSNGEYYLKKSDGYKTETISESLAITPAIKHLHKDKLQEVLTNKKTSESDKLLQEELEAVEKYDIVTQALHGLRKHYSHKSTDMYPVLKKDKNKELYTALFKATGTDDILPMYALPASMNDGKDSDRAGQHFFIKQLIAYDKFGRVLPLITENRFVQGAITKVPKHLQIAEELAINELIRPFSWELTPKVALPCKLHVKESQLNDQFLNTNCIQGFLIVNHFESTPSLFVYSSKSSFLGEVYINKTQIQWQPGPESDVQEVQDLKKVSEALFDFVNNFINKPLDINSFTKIIKDIEALKAYKFPENIRVSDNLQLVGKPIALIKQEYYISTNESVNYLNNKTKTLNLKIGETPEMTTKHGEYLHTNDGVLGYYTYDNKTKKAYNFNKFYVNNEPDKLPNNTITFNYKEGKSSSLKTLQLVDPYMNYHIHSGVLPVVAFKFDPNEIASLIENMTFYFKVNHLLTHVNEYVDEHQQKEKHQVMPLPNPIHGKWTWQSISDTSSNWQEISNYNEHDNFADTKIEAGFLKLINQDHHE